jgi:predicted transcriptional regulator
MSPYGDMKPSPTEFVILKHLWRAEPQSQGEIHKAVESHLNWSRSSTRKTVERMLDKGMLRTEEAHGTRIYFAQLKKIPTIAVMVQNFAANVLGLDGPLPVSNLVKSDVLSETELRELDAYLKEIVSASNTPSQKAGGEA